VSTKKRPTRARKAAPKAKAAGRRIRATPLGRVVLVEYVRDGKRWRHEFKKATPIGFLSVLSSIVIPAKLTRGRFIAD
jgi:hypothetical protein